MNNSQLYLNEIKGLTQQVPKLSPYNFITPLENEITEDTILVGIQSLCDMIIFEVTCDDYIDEIEYGVDFCTAKIAELEDIRSAFELTVTSGPLSRIGHSLDMITCQEELGSFNNRSLYVDLAYNIQSLSERLDIYLSILSAYLTKHIV